MVRLFRAGRLATVYGRYKIPLTWCACYWSNQLHDSMLREHVSQYVTFITQWQHCQALVCPNCCHSDSRSLIPFHIRWTFEICYETTWWLQCRYSHSESLWSPFIFLLSMYILCCIRQPILLMHTTSHRKIILTLWDWNGCSFIDLEYVKRY